MTFFVSTSRVADVLPSGSLGLVPYAMYCHEPIKLGEARRTSADDIHTAKTRVSRILSNDRSGFGVAADGRYAPLDTQVAVQSAAPKAANIDAINGYPAIVTEIPDCNASAPRITGAVCLEKEPSFVVT